MKRFFIMAVLGVAALTTPAIAADVGVSISVGQPGFYGRIDIGDYPYPYPRVIYSQPRIVEHVVITHEPIYMRVPPGHRNNWRKHCHRYNACGERVYFVRDDWYHHEYAPVYRSRHYHNRHDDHRYRHGDDYGHDYGDKKRGKKNYGNKEHRKHR